MEIDWFTVIAQVINFLVLVWLLKRFLYKPVLKAIDEREKRIAAQLQEAASAKKEAEQEHREFDQKNKQFDEQRETQMKRAAEEVKAEKQRLLDEARDDAHKMRIKLEQGIQEARQNITRDINSQVEAEVIGLTTRVLSQLASANLEAQVISTFLQRLNNLGDKEKKAFADALCNNEKKITIKSAFEINKVQQQQLQQAIDSVTGTSNSFQYQTAPALVNGIEVSVKNFKLSWNMEAYLADLRKKIAAGKDQPKEANVTA